jgi:hypothetical protein
MNGIRPYDVLADGRLRATCRDVAMGLLVGFALLPALASTRLSERRPAESVDARVERMLATRDLLATEVSFARDGAGPAEARRSAQSVEAFVRARSGLVLDERSSERLADLESRTLRGDLRRLTPDDLAGLFTDVALERARDASDDEIEFAAEALGNRLAVGLEGALSAEDQARWTAARQRARLDRDARLRRAMSANDLGAVRSDRPLVRNGVTLRANGFGGMSAEEFVSQTKEFRVLLRQPQLYLEISGRVREAAAAGIAKRVGELASALPDTWGGTTERGLSPVQVFLLAYSAVSDDALVYRTSTLDEARRRILGPELGGSGREPYGTGGFLFSTPLEMVFDARTVAGFLDRAEERSRR